MWKETPKILERTFEFKDFTQAFAFMTEAAFHCEKQGHHPNWSNVYNKVTVHLNTHDAGDMVTAKDHKLAKAMDDVFAKYDSKS